MALNDDEEKKLRAELADAKKAFEELKANAGEHSADDVKALKAQLEALNKELEAKKSAGPGEIKGVSEASVHAMLEAVKGLDAKLANNAKSDRVRWMP